MGLKIRKANREECPVILEFIRLLAKYEKLENEVTANIPQLEKTLFDEKTSSEVYLGFIDDNPIAMALIFQNYSTFLAKPGIYLEDLFVKEEFRGKGVGKKLLQFLANLAVERKCGRLEWSVLDWNKQAIDFYKSIGAISMDGWTINRLTGDTLRKLSLGYQE